MSSAILAPFAFVHSGTKNANGESVGTSTMITRIKTEFLSEFPGARIEFKKSNRVRGENVHVFWILIPKGSESRYQKMLEKIGKDFHQGNGFVVYKWKNHIVETPPPSRELSAKSAYRLSYGPMSNTWGVSLTPEIAASIIHCPRRP
jgi:hypothetical protein